MRFPDRGAWWRKASAVGAVGLASLHVTASCAPKPAASLAARSPDGRISIIAGRLPGGTLAIRVRHDGADVIAPSRVGLRLQEGAVSRVRLLRVAEVRPEAAPDRKEAPFQELRVEGVTTTGPERRFTLRLRAYDTGAAFRLEVPTGPLTVSAELTRFRFAGDYDCLAAPHTRYVNSHEGDYRPVKASALKPATLYDLPLSCRTGRAGETIALTESDVEHYPGAYLAGGAGRGVEVRLTPSAADERVAAGPRDAIRTPWRVVMIADKPERLIENRLVSDLAPPSRIGDSRWVKPGKAAWGWWSGIKTAGVPGAGFNNATYRYYVDFAGRFGLPYFMIDWGWAARPNGNDQLADVTRFRQGVDIPALARYARTRGVRLWLWTNWKAIAPRMDTAFALYERWGVAGIKVDYVYRQDQVAIDFYHRLLATAARHHLLVDIHGSPVPRGLERTYPNLLTQEGVMGAEYNKWSRKVTAGWNVRAAYTRAVIGPMDYTPGGMRNVAPGDFHARHVRPLVMTTRAQQLAMFVVYPSPLQSLCDAPDAYAHAAGADFLRTVPAAWDETLGLAGGWNQWIAVARRSGGRWFIGILNDEHARTVEIPLTRLGGGAWRVRGWIDANRPTDLRSSRATVDGHGALRIPLAASGGAALMLEPG